MAPFPDRLKCGAFTYQIESVTRLRSHDHDSLAGQHSFNDLAIRLDDALIPSQRRSTLLHEVVHAVAAERDISLNEHEVDQLSNGLLQVLVDNPGLTSLFLTEPPD